MVRPKKSWQISEVAPVDYTETFNFYHPTITQLFYNRGIKTTEEAVVFLHPNYQQNIFDPYLFSSMEAATDLVIDNIKKALPIVIYGDYDADGVTSASVLYETLKLLKANVSIYIPDRVIEGYGLNLTAIEDISKNGAKLIITVDNGIRSKAEVEFAKSLGLSVLITDHHVSPDNLIDLPDCLIVNPMVPEEKYPFKNLAGVGVAFKLASAIIKKTKLDDSLKLRLEERVLDLVAIGTVADCMILRGENRILVKKGLEIINRHKRIGLNELFKQAKINQEKTIDAWNIGFQIAPRLNAAGRLDHANAAFNLLVADDENEASQLAASLNDSNTERQQITEDIVKNIISQITEDYNDKIIIAVSPDGQIWNEGVIGLAAGRISERFYLPTLVITGDGEEFKGSGRSAIDDFNLIKIVEDAKNFTTKYGGHKSACGFSIKGRENLDSFIKEVKIAANKELSDRKLISSLKIEAEIEFNLLTEELINNIEAFAPFGEGNPRPTFVSRELLVSDLLKMGDSGQHLKLRLVKDNSTVKNAIGFGMSSNWPELKIGDKIDLVYYLEINYFQGRKEVQLKIIDLIIL